MQPARHGPFAWKAATLLFLAGYAVATVVGFALYLVGPAAMWIGMFTAMPVVFAWLALRYLRGPGAGHADSAPWALGAWWITLSFGLDAAVYIVVLPLAGGAPVNWTFFVDQSPWIWLAYATLGVAVAVAHRMARAARPG